MIFTKKNYYMLIIAFAIVILGFYLMYGTTDVMSPIKITISPIVVMIGYILCAYSILIKSK